MFISTKWKFVLIPKMMRSFNYYLTLSFNDNSYYYVRGLFMYLIIIHLMSLLIRRNFADEYYFKTFKESLCINLIGSIIAGKIKSLMFAF